MAGPFSKLPLRAGIGLKPQHYSELLTQAGRAPAAPGAAPGWVEVHPQNYFVAGGPALRWLEEVAAHYPVSFHSTGLSLGSADGPNITDLDQLIDLSDHIGPAIISDHLSWSVSGTDNFPDLLPLPYTRGALDQMARAVALVQDRLGRPMLVENPSRYLAFADDTMEEPEFLDRLCRMTGCGLLFDINNVVVSANNLGLDAGAMVDMIDPALVGEVHLAGHAVEDHGDFCLLIDDHGSAVGEVAWALYRRFVARAGPRPTLIEWDSDVPDYAILMAEAAKADAILASVKADDASAA
jgi:uncharacterized protein